MVKGTKIVSSAYNKQTRWRPHNASLLKQGLWYILFTFRLLIRCYGIWNELKSENNRNHLIEFIINLHIKIHLLVLVQQKIENVKFIEEIVRMPF